MTAAPPKKALWRSALDHLVDVVVILALLILGLGCGDEETGPHITALLPASAQIGAQVDILGERFSGQERGVFFAGQAAFVRFWNDQRVRVQVPQLPSGHTVVVLMIDGQPSNEMTFLVTP